MENILFAFALTLFAGLSTGVGSALAFFTNKTNTKFLSASLGFSAGVMIYVSFAEILVKGKESLVNVIGLKAGSWLTVASFFGGIFLIALIDKLVPSYENSHNIKSIEDVGNANSNDLEEDKKKSLERMGLMSALAIAIHNFPEGLATFTAALEDPSLGIPIAVAIAIHNVPEGIAVSIPLYYATGSRKRAFYYSFASGLSEPLGAIVGYLLLSNFFNDLTFGILFGVVAGIMVYISLDELLPAAEKYGEHHISIYGLILGMIVMAVSLLLFI